MRIFRAASASAIARPTRRPAPVTSATRPPSSTLLLERGDDLARGRCAARGETDRAVASDADHGALNLSSILLHRAIRRRDRAVAVDEERKVELELRRILCVAGDAGRVHAERLNPCLLKFGQIVAHGGQLPIAA